MFRINLSPSHILGCWLGSFVILQGLRTSIAKKPYIFVIFRGGVCSGSAHDANLFKVGVVLQGYTKGLPVKKLFKS